MDILFSGLIKGPALFGLVGSVDHRHLILGRLFKGLTSLPNLALLVLLVAAAKIVAVKVGTSADWPACLVGPPALSAHLFVFCLLLSLTIVEVDL
jgi:hypothetical protein